MFFPKKTISELTLHESPLFYYIEMKMKDNNNGQLFGYRITRKNNNGREVFYVHLSIRKEETFINPTFKCIDKHISIDRYVTDENKSPLDYFFSHYHFTFEYEYQQGETEISEKNPENYANNDWRKKVSTKEEENSQENQEDRKLSEIAEEKKSPQKIVGHVYCNRFGKPIQYNVKEIFPNSTARILSKNDSLRAFLYQQTNALAETLIATESYPSTFMQLLLNEKQQDYLKLVEKSQKKEREVANLQHCFERSNFSDETLKNQAISGLRELLQIIQEINKYDEFASDKRDILIKENIEYLSNEVFNSNSNCSPSASSSLGGGEDDERTLNFHNEKLEPNQEINSKARKPKKNSKKKKSSPHPNNINLSPLILETSSTFISNRPNSLDPQSNENILTYLSTLSPYSLRAGRFIRQHSDVLKKYFHEKMLVGDLNNIIVLYPYLVNHEQTFITTCFQHLIDHLIHQDCSEEDSKKLVAIGDFFYQTSEIYRCVVLLKNQQQYISSNGNSTETKFSLLAGLFMKNNFSAFSLFLKQGINFDSSVNSSLIRGQTVKLIWYIISEFQPHFDMRFIDTLYDYGAFNQECQSIKNIYFSRPEESDLSIFFRTLNQIDHFFTVAIKKIIFSPDYPFELVKRLATWTDVKTLFYSISDLIAHANIEFYAIADSSSSASCCLESFEEFNHHYQHLTKGSASHDKVVVLFYEKQHRLHHIFTWLLQEITKKFREVTKEIQLEIINFLMNAATKALVDSPTLGNSIVASLAITAQLANSLLTDLTIDDYITRLQLFILSGKIKERANLITSAEYFYQQATKILKKLPLEIKQEHEIKSIIEEISFINISTTRPELKQLRTRLLFAKELEKKGKEEAASKLYSQLDLTIIQEDIPLQLVIQQKILSLNPESSNLIKLSIFNDLNSIPQTPIPDGTQYTESMQMQTPNCMQS